MATEQEIWRAIMESRRFRPVTKDDYVKSAMLLKNLGNTISEIADKMNRSIRTIRRYLENT